MEHLIKLRHFSSSLSADEFQEFTTKFGGQRIVQIIADALLGLLQNVNNLNEIDNVIIPKVSEMNQCMASIIRSRNRRKQTKVKHKHNVPESTLSLQQLPKENISAIASYLRQSEYTKFERCSRALFIAARSVPVNISYNLNRLFQNFIYDLDVNKKWSVYRWHRFDGVKSIRMHRRCFQYLQIPFISTLLRKLQSIEVLDYNRCYWLDIEHVQALSTVELKECAPILGGIQKLDVTEAFLSEIGYKHFRSLTALKVSRWFDSEWTEWRSNFGASNVDWLEWLIQENITTLSEIEIHQPHWCDAEADMNDLLRPITLIYDQCMMHPEWTCNVLKSVNIEISGITVYDFYDYDAKDAVMPLIDLFMRNNVSFSFSFEIDWCDWGSEEQLTLNEEVQYLQQMFGIWRVKAEHGDSVSCITLQTNDRTNRSQTRITDYFNTAKGTP